MSFIGLAINHARTRAGMSNKALAEQTGLSQQFVGDVQRGQRIPTMETMLLFANVFPDVDSAQWAWYVVRDLYGAPLADLLWGFAVVEEKRRERDRKAQGRGEDQGDHGDLREWISGADGDPGGTAPGGQAPENRWPHTGNVRRERLTGRS